MKQKYGFKRRACNEGLYTKTNAKKRRIRKNCWGERSHMKTYEYGFEVYDIFIRVRDSDTQTRF